LRLKSGSFQLLVLRGRTNNQAKLYEAAVADFSQVLASKSQGGFPAGDRVALHNERALALLKLDRSADARADVDEALRIAPENAAAIATLGLIDEALGRKSEAMASYARALAIKPDIEVAKRELERLGPPDATSLPVATPAPEPASETPSSATLYTSEHRTSTNEFPTLAQCEAAAKFFRAHAPLRDRSLVYCVKHARSADPERKS
jgi:tetratricopeptide (TPR) repeat protein